MFAAHHNLDNLVALIDYNKLQSLTTVEKTLKLEPIGKKFEAFGWSATTVDGHDIDSVQSTLQLSKETRKGKPKVVIAKTLKGKGVPGLENQPLCHIINPSVDTLDNILKD